MNAIAPLQANAGREVLRQAMLVNLREKVSFYPGLLHGMTVHDEAGLRLVDADLDCDTFNCIVGTTTLDDSGRDLAKGMVDRFVARRHAMAWWLISETGSDPFERFLLSLGLTHDETDIGMVAPLDSLPPERDVAGLTIQPVTTAEGIGDFAGVLSDVFDPPDEHVITFFRQVAPLNLTTPMHLFVACLNGRPVATGSVFLGGGLAGIFDVATANEARGRGIGTAMTIYCMHAARRLGYRAAVLQASPDGLGIYRKSGFHELATWKTYGNGALLDTSEKGCM